jgi:hypothetical protein
MFKRVIQSLSKSLSRQQAGTPAVVPDEAAPAPAKAKPAAKPEAPLKPMETVVKPDVSPEELCGIDAKMNKEAIRERLKLLYARFNRAASSLDEKTRREADVMLDAIVAVREKHFGTI